MLALACLRGGCCRKARRSHVGKKIKIEPGSVQETLIIPLYGRKLCA